MRCIEVSDSTAANLLTVVVAGSALLPQVDMEEATTNKPSAVDTPQSTVRFLGGEATSLIHIYCCAET